MSLREFLTLASISGALVSRWMTGKREVDRLGEDCRLPCSERFAAAIVNDMAIYQQLSETQHGVNARPFAK